MRTLMVQQLLIALFLSAFIAFLTGGSSLVFISIIGLSISAFILIMGCSAKQCDKQPEAELAHQYNPDVQQTAHALPQFTLSGKVYRFIETYSATVIDVSPCHGQIRLITDTGREKQLPDYGIPFRKSHRIRKYELRQCSASGDCNVFRDALIINVNTGEYELTLARKCIIIPAIFTLFFPNSSVTSHYKLMPVPLLFSVIFTLLSAVAFISFLLMLWSIKEEQIWGEYRYAWLAYFLSRGGSFICINWMKQKSKIFDNKIVALVEAVRH
ncbi:hypothetical protein PT300_13810 [Enterobacteriaceae bacterium ESL0689]|nr:hypothetical protein [Enterobacteriaceae bacterium ESL0689]